jgi:hypothetical protein
MYTRGSDSGFAQCESWSQFSGVASWSLLMKTIRIDQLRPTQMTHGLREVRNKTRSYKALAGHELQMAIAEKPIPVVYGPLGAPFAIDHHHVATALLRLRRGGRPMRRGGGLGPSPGRPPEQPHLRGHDRYGGHEHDCRCLPRHRTVSRKVRAAALRHDGAPQLKSARGNF